MPEFATVGGARDRYLIVAPPPTPNGGLHIGHLSGPYLAADVFRRECLALGHEAWLAVSTDDYQIYVDTTAARLGRSPDALIEESRREIEETARRYALGIGQLGGNDTAYDRFVAGFFAIALDRKLIEITEVSVAVDSASDVRLEGPQLTGACPSCLAPACGGICEACGDPNDGFDLIPLYAGGAAGSVREPRLTLDLEACRRFLTDFLDACHISSPKLREKLSDWMARPLGRFILSYPVARGVDSPDGRKLNVWAEMYPGHFHHLERVCGRVLPTDRYVQFLGFDNSWFYTIVHGALAWVARECGHDWPLPEALVVNRFYNLGYEKFSTSRGIAVWANDLADRMNPDLIRWFLALHGPEHDEASFDSAAAEERMRGLAALINRIAAAVEASGVTADAALRPPFDRLLAPRATPRRSMRDVAVAALRQLEFLDQRLAAGDAEIAGQASLVLRTALASLCPAFVDRMRLGEGARIPMFGPSGRVSGQ